MKKTKFFALIVCLTLAATLFVSCAAPAPAEDADSKTITIEVIDAEGSSEEFQVSTTGETLGDAIDENGFASGSESDFGLFVETVNGITADMNKEEWWMISKDGTALMTGVDETEISDGDHFEFTFTIGWE